MVKYKAVFVSWPMSYNNKNNVGYQVIYSNTIFFLYIKSSNVCKVKVIEIGQSLFYVN